MRKITTVADLKSAMHQLENKQANELAMLKRQFHQTYENLKPLNLIKNSFREVTSAPDFKDDLLGALVGLAAGFISKKLLVGASHNPLKKISGILLQLGMSTIVTKNPEIIKLLTDKIVNFFNKKKETKVESN